MTNTTIDRFQVLSHNELTYPHKCAICGSFSGDNDKRFVDFGLFVEFYGQVYICTGCFSSAGKTIFPTVGEISDSAKAQIKELQAVITTLINENRILRDAVDDLRNSIANRPDSDSSLVRVESGKVIEAGSDRRSEEPEVSNTNTAGINTVGEEDKSGSPEQTHVEGSTHVRENDNSESPIIGLDTFNL